MVNIIEQNSIMTIYIKYRKQTLLSSNNIISITNTDVYKQFLIE